MRSNTLVLSIASLLGGMSYVADMQPLRNASGARVPADSRMGRSLISFRSSSRSKYRPHDGAKQALKAEFMLDKEGNKKPGLHFCQARETIVNTAGEDLCIGV